jgi:hypothetical protein
MSLVTIESNLLPINTIEETAKVKIINNKAIKIEELLRILFLIERLFT